MASTRHLAWIGLGLALAACARDPAPSVTPSSPTTASAPSTERAPPPSEDRERAMARVNHETLRIIEKGAYRSAFGRAVDIRGAIEASVRATRLYTPEELEALLARPRPAQASARRPRIEVTEEKTMEAVVRLRREGATAIAALNYASAVKPAGAFPEGAGTQEEDLVRSSGLWSCLLAQPRYYEANRAEGTPYYTDHVLYSPDVPFFRGPDLALLDEPVLVAIITAPAPFAGQILERDPTAAPRIHEVFRRRIGKVLEVAAVEGRRALVLGPWGCGAFRNDPHVVAGMFADWLADARFQGAFDRIVFSAYDPAPGQPRLHAFRARFPPPETSP